MLQECNIPIQCYQRQKVQEYVHAGPWNIVGETLAKRGKSK